MKTKRRDDGNVHMGRGTSVKRWGSRSAHRLATVSLRRNVQVTPTTNGGGGDGVRGLQARKCKSRSIDISETASNTLLGVSCLVWLEWNRWYLWKVLSFSFTPDNTRHTKTATATLVFLHPYPPHPHHHAQHISRAPPLKNAIWMYLRFWSRRERITLCAFLNNYLTFHWLKVKIFLTPIIKCECMHSVINNLSWHLLYSKSIKINLLYIILQRPLHDLYISLFFSPSPCTNFNQVVPFGALHLFFYTFHNPLQNCYPLFSMSYTFMTENPVFITIATPFTILPMSSIIN